VKLLFAGHDHLALDRLARPSIDPDANGTARLTSGRGAVIAETTNGLLHVERAVQHSDVPGVCRCPALGHDAGARRLNRA